MKNRLEDPTHDVLTCIQLPGIGVIAEVQFSFRSVLLVKSFAHAAYRIERVNLNARGGFREMLDCCFTLPRTGAKSAGNYNTRKKSDICIVAVDH